MAQTEPPATRQQIAGVVGRLGVLTTALAALVLTAVLIGNLLVLVVKVPVSPWLFAIVDIGPILGVFFANIGTGVNYYGSWRVLRGLDEYDVRSDAKNQAQSVPGMLQWVPQALLGCLPVASALLLAASLIISALTLAPAPIHTLGFALTPSSRTGNTSGTSNGNSTHNSSGNSSGDGSRSPNATPHVQFALRNASATQQCDAPATVLSPLVVTLDNSGSNVEVRWELTQIDTLSTSTPWASASAATGTVGAGKTESLTLTPTAQLCSQVPPQGATYRASVHIVGGDTFSIADQVGAVPHLALSLSTSTQRQSCPSFYSALPAVSLILDNSASNVAATWQLGDIQLIPGTPHAWATASAISGTVPAGQKATLSLTPHPKLCYWNPLPGKVYHATLQWSGGQSATIADTIISPPLPPPPPQAAPPPSPPAPVMWLGISPQTYTQACSGGSIDAYRVTLVNGGSYAVNWTFAATDTLSASDSTPWAVASPASGSVPAGGTAEFTVTPNSGICAIPGNPTYHATLAQSGNGQNGPSQTLSDQIGVATSVAFGVSPASKSQTCSRGSVGAYTVTFDNTKSNVPVAWSFATSDTTPDGQPWATASNVNGSASNVIGAGQTKDINIIPTADVCTPGGTTAYHATIRATSPGGATTYGSATITDSITEPILVALTADPPTHDDTCYLSETFGPTPYVVTLTNTGNVPVTWSFTHVDQVDATAWASFADAHGAPISGGTLAPGERVAITVSPYNDNENGLGVCNAGPATYNATITAQDVNDTTQSTTAHFSDVFEPSY